MGQFKALGRILILTIGNKIALFGCDFGYFLRKMLRLALLVFRFFIKNPLVSLKKCLFSCAKSESKYALASRGLTRIIFFGALLHVGVTPLFSADNSAESARDELRENVKKAGDQLQATQKKIEKLNETLKDGKKSLEMLNQEVAAKNLSHDEMKSSLKRAESSYHDSRRSEEDFQKSLGKDREQQELVQRDIELTKRRLARLEENLSILQTNIESDEDNLKKVARAREFWEKNLKSYHSSLKELDGLLKELEGRFKEQRASNDAAEKELARWMKLRESQRADLEGFEKGP